MDSQLDLEKSAIKVNTTQTGRDMEVARKWHPGPGNGMFKGLVVRSKA